MLLPVQKTENPYETRKWKDGAIETTHSFDSDGMMRITRVQDVDPIMEAVKHLREVSDINTLGRRTGFLEVAAVIPQIIYNRWRAEALLLYPHDPEAVNEYMDKQINHYQIFHVDSGCFDTRKKYNV